MARIEEIERAIEELPRDEFITLYEWVKRHSEASKAVPTQALQTTEASLKAEPQQTAERIEIVRRASEVLGVDHVANWLQSKIPSLDYQTPYSLLESKEGRDKIERVLSQIEHGVY